VRSGEQPDANRVHARSRSVDRPVLAVHGLAKRDAWLRLPLLGDGVHAGLRVQLLGRRDRGRVR